MKEKHYIGDRLTSFKSTGSTDPVDGVILKVDEETAYLSGDQTGYVLELECPYGTQAMADSIMAGLQGKSYAGYEAAGAQLPSGAELGDGVTVKGLYGPLIRRRVQFGGDLTSDISAPAGGKMDHEFNYTDPTLRKIEQAVARARSYVDRKADEIRIGVENLDNSVRAELKLKVGKDDNDQIVSMLNAAADEINIKGNRFVLDSDNFKVGADGTITAKKANVTGNITGSKISGSSFDSQSGAYLMSLWAAVFKLMEEDKLRVRIYTTGSESGVNIGLLQVFSGNITDAGWNNDENARCSYITPNRVGIGQDINGVFHGMLECNDVRATSVKCTKLDSTKGANIDGDENNPISIGRFGSDLTRCVWREITDGSGNKVTVLCRNNVS